jgi:hypothetical protein
MYHCNDTSNKIGEVGPNWRHTRRGSRPADTEPYPDPIDPSFERFFAAGLYRHDPDFATKVEALAKAAITNDSSLSLVHMSSDSPSEFDSELGKTETTSDWRSSPGDRFVSNDMWTSEIEEIACDKVKDYLAECVRRDCGPDHAVNWEPTGSGFFEIHDEYVANWDQPLRFYLMYHYNGTFKWVPGGALRNFPDIVQAHKDQIAGNIGDDEDEE